MSRDCPNIDRRIAHLPIATDRVLLMALLGCFFSTASLAQEPEAAFSKVTSHWIEISAGSGTAIPASWYSTSRNQSVGLNITGSVLLHLGKGWGVGIGGDWSRLPWTPKSGPSAHVDTWIVGPELRYTDHHLGRVAPLAYLGLGLGGISQFRKSSCDEVFGGPGARAGPTHLKPNDCGKIV